MGKDEGRVAALWPGSCLHAVRAMAEPRWEDFDYVGLDADKGVKNRFYWLGDGWTENEKKGEGDRSWYLEDIDYPPGELPFFFFVFWVWLMCLFVVPKA